MDFLFRFVPSLSHRGRQIIACAARDEDLSIVRSRVWIRSPGRVGKKKRRVEAPPIFPFRKRLLEHAEHVLLLCPGVGKQLSKLCQGRIRGRRLVENPINQSCNRVEQLQASPPCERPVAFQTFQHVRLEYRTLRFCL